MEPGVSVRLPENRYLSFFVLICVPEIDRRRGNRNINKFFIHIVHETVDVPIGKANNVSFPKIHRVIMI